MIPEERTVGAYFNLVDHADYFLTFKVDWADVAFSKILLGWDRM